MKIVKKVQLKIVIFTAVNYRCILHGNVCVMIPDNGILSLFWNSRSAGTKGLAPSRSIASAAGSIMTKSRWLLYDKSTSDNSVYQSQLLEGVECHIYLYCFTFDDINLNRAFVIIVLFPKKYSNKK